MGCRCNDGKRTFSLCIQVFSFDHIGCSEFLGGICFCLGTAISKRVVVDDMF